MADYKFPEHFIWGTATSAHQVEGQNDNCDIWLMEHTPQTMFREPSGNACEHYERYPADIALLAELGFNSYRFSIEWARVEPKQGEFSADAINHYRDVLKCCHDHNLKPYVSLHHFTSPIWLVAQGGWIADSTPALFARYAAKIAEALGDAITGICTINEANIGRVLTSSGMMPPLSQIQASPGWIQASEQIGIAPDKFMPFMFAVTDKGMQTVMAAHHQAVTAIKAVRPQMPCGITLAVQDIVAVSGGEAVATRHRHEVNEVFLSQLSNDDFVGVQCYTRHRFDANGPIGPEEGVELTLMGYEFWPEALEATIRQAFEGCGLPVLITENGIGTNDDNQRIEYVKRALRGVINCIEDGIPILGYTYWSAMDNFEWMLGYGPTFGLIAVDRQTQERTVKNSGRWLGQIARKNLFSQ